MRVLVTGANGFLGRRLVPALVKKGFDVLATGRQGLNRPGDVLQEARYSLLDFTDPFQVHDVFTEFAPEVVIHAGAMTRVDECETKQWQAYITNVEGTLHLLLNAAEYKSHFIFLSTDFVFDGIKGDYAETDDTGPVNFYGRTKVEAEEAVREYEYEWSIVRTILVYGPSKENDPHLLATVKRKLQQNETYKLVTDQYRTPTFIDDLVDALIRIVEQKAVGIFHISGKDKLTPYDMGLAIARYIGADENLLIPVTADVFKEPAKRPARTGFDLSKARTVLGFEPLSFEQGLSESI